MIHGPCQGKGLRDALTTSPSVKGADSGRVQTVQMSITTTPAFTPANNAEQVPHNNACCTDVGGAEAQPTQLTRRPAG